MDPKESGILKGLSPEEILAKKEQEGGIVYDDPILEPQETFPSQENIIPTPIVKEEKIDPPPIIPKTFSTPEPPVSLGKAETFNPAKNSFSPGLEMGWKNLPMSVLPSKGLFYPEGTKIAIRPADVKEIRHFSSIDEEDLLDLNEKLNFIISKCSTMHFPNEGVVSFMDLKQEDRFFLIMAIRDLTFVQGENRIVITPKTDCKDKASCPLNSGVELRTGVLSSYDLDPQLMNYYSSESRNFVFPVKKLGKQITMSVPSIGVSKAIDSFVNDCKIKGIPVEESFVQIAPFLFEEWRELDNRKILIKMRESDEWSKEEFSLYFELSNRIKIGTDLDIRIGCPKCGAEVAAPITFPRGFKSLFLISDIFTELL